MWMEHPEYAEVMEKFWNESEDGRARWSEKLRECKRMFKNWNNASFGNVQKRINKLKKELDDIKKLERTVEVVEKENEITEELDLWLAREETLWMQRSRVLWLKQGDKNTNFFHATASHGQKKNWISKLRDANGVMQEDQGKVREIVTDYFRDMFWSALRVEDSVLQGQLESMPRLINDEMNSWLMSDISEEEIRRAVFSLGPLKAPGIDGFPALLYHKSWDRIKGSVCREVKRFWQEGSLDAEINKTLIVLIPKKVMLTELKIGVRSAFALWQLRSSQSS
ncbi:hypothetical protein QQ045_020336 [Rhodiola kirilowii]